LQTPCKRNISKQLNKFVFRWRPWFQASSGYRGRSPLPKTYEK